jgi:hypothetical protein
VPLRWSSLSTDDVMTQITPRVGVDVNKSITQDVVQFAFITGGLPPRRDPGATDWLNGRWVVLDNGLTLAAILVGPSGGVITLTKGKWACWVRVVDNPTVPVTAFDTLTLY